MSISRRARILLTGRMSLVAKRRMTTRMRNDSEYEDLGSYTRRIHGPQRGRMSYGGSLRWKGWQQ